VAIPDIAYVFFISSVVHVGDSAPDPPGPRAVFLVGLLLMNIVAPTVFAISPRRGWWLLIAVQAVNVALFAQTVGQLRGIGAYGLELAVPVFSGVVAIALVLFLRYSTARK